MSSANTTAPTSSEQAIDWQQLYAEANTAEDKETVICKLIAARIQDFAKQQAGADCISISGLGSRETRVLVRLGELNLPTEIHNGVRIHLSGPENPAESAALVCQGFEVLLSGKVQKAEASLGLPRPKRVLDLHQQLLASGFTSEQLGNFDAQATSRSDALWQELRVQIPQTTAAVCAQNNAVYRIEETEDGLTVFTQKHDGSSNCFERKELGEQGWEGTSALTKLCGCF